jgi:hypothetical protein
VPAGPDIEQRFVAAVSEWLVGLPHDLNVLYDVASDPNVDRVARELAIGTVIYALTPHETDRKDFAAYADDVILLHLAMQRIAATCGPDAGSVRERFAETAPALDEQVAVCAQVMGRTFDWLAGKIDQLRVAPYKGKKVAEYVDDTEASEFLYEEVLVFRTEYPIDENLLGMRLKKASTITEAIERRKSAEERKR